jgi:hypothetical protein
MYAVTVEPLNSIFFVSDRPEPGPWLSRVEEGVGLDFSFYIYSWPDGEPPPEQVVGVSIEDPKHYKIFKYASEVERAGFRPTGKNFGGIFSKGTWERFAAELPTVLTLPPGEDEERQAPLLHASEEGR